MPSHVNRGHKRPRFESLQQTMDKLNDKLREFPLPGRVVGVDTVTIKLAPEDCSGQIEVDPLETMCMDEYNTHQLSFIRLFYVKDRPRFETIGE
ncbi:hypothetical protein NP493_430g01000 [Ridgeia piscesae]|uniref:Uncharacterized protein n=1 Tax=Ridgeia piscesae TaxID=27915 RepID=A0AAD9KZZ3_RIDPI|nr:hypothetical protein NP493_430g01000 [Ridgeia piscesae]